MIIPKSQQKQTTATHTFSTTFNDDEELRDDEDMEDEEYEYNEDENLYGENARFVDRLYDVDVDDENYDYIDTIRYDDDEIMEDMDSQLSRGHISSYDEFSWWYSDIENNNLLETKYLKKRIKNRLEKEGLPFDGLI
jgi:hypothetical protein